MSAIVLKKGLTLAMYAGSKKKRIEFCSFKFSKRISGCILTQNEKVFDTKR